MQIAAIEKCYRLQRDFFSHWKKRTSIYLQGLAFFIFAYFFANFTLLCTYCNWWPCTTANRITYSFHYHFMFQVLHTLVHKNSTSLVHFYSSTIPWISNETQPRWTTLIFDSSKVLDTKVFSVRNNKVKPYEPKKKKAGSRLLVSLLLFFFEADWGCSVMASFSLWMQEFELPGLSVSLIKGPAYVKG